MLSDSADSCNIVHPSVSPTVYRQLRRGLYLVIIAACFVEEYSVNKAGLSTMQDRHMTRAPQG